VQDLTTGSLSRHLLKTMSFMLVGMIFQTLYVLVDLYWVSHLGTEAVAAVGLSGNLMFVVLGLTQMLGVGTTALISHAVGRKDQVQARLVFGQAQVLAIVAGAMFLVVAMALRGWYTRTLAADDVTATLAADYLLWFIPAMGMQFGLVAMGAALRGTGAFKPGMLVQTGTVILNMALAPLLIFGWITPAPLGVAGAALSTLVAVAAGMVWMLTYFRPGAYLTFERADWRPRTGIWAQIVKIGLPAGAEFIMLTVYMVLVYTVSRPFGAMAQAGFGIGGRLMQAAFLPVVALGFAVAPVAGQNFGARLADRVRRTFTDAAFMAGGAMAIAAVSLHIWADPAMRLFTHDPPVIAFGVEYLRIISWNFVAAGVVFVSSSMFQALGHTLPALATSIVRVAAVAIPILALSRSPGFTMRWVWYLSVLASYLQMILNVILLRREFQRRLQFDAPPAVSEPAPV
jgi:putative MATE family efflux protein